MAIPSRVEAARLLLSLDPPAWHLRHSRAVAEVAGWLALRAERAGRTLDRRLVEAAALLHDVDKLPAVRPLVPKLSHGEGSAAWLTRSGYAELAAAVAGHPVTRLADAAWFDRWLESARPEELTVAYADKRAGQRLESLGERFGSWRRRYPPGRDDPRSAGWSAETVDAVQARAGQLERRVCELARVAPGAVARLPWTSGAIAAARTGRPGETRG